MPENYPRKAHSEGGQDELKKCLNGIFGFKVLGASGCILRHQPSPKRTGLGLYGPSPFEGSLLLIQLFEQPWEKLC